MTTNSIEASARTFAERAHGAQTYGADKPYVTHLDDVRAVLAEYGYEEGSDHGVAAFLHDVLEDTDTTPETLDLVFGPRVTSLVWVVTGVGKTRKERNENAYAKMAAYPSAIPLKLADRIANGRRSAENSPRFFAMYRSEYPDFRARLRPWSDTRDAPMWEELDRIFGWKGTS